jgi:hypothetical protein
VRADEREIPPQAVCQQFDCTQEQVRMEGRKKNTAREIAIYLARDLTGLSCKDFGTYFDGVSGALISIMCNRIAGESPRKKKLTGKIEKTKREIFNILDVTLYSLYSGKCRYGCGTSESSRGRIWAASLQ